MMVLPMVLLLMFTGNLYVKRDNQMEQVRETWKDISIKNKLAIITAIAAFVVGWGLTIAGFIVPPLGEVADSVLFVLGQALIYSASVFGITAYFKSESIQLKKEMKGYLEEKERMLVDKYQEK